MFTNLEILGDGTQEKPYMHVSDLVEGVLFAMKELNREAANIYNIGVDLATSVLEIGDRVCSGMGLKDVRYRFTGGKYRVEGRRAPFPLRFVQDPCRGMEAAVYL